MGDNKIKTVAVSGAGGFIGSHLRAYLLTEGYDVVPISRHHFTDKGAAELGEIISQADAVANLAGAPINHRWTPKYKQELYHSRIDTTRRIVNAMQTAGGRPKTLCSASAVGYYSSTAPVCNTESEHTPGTGYLSLLCRAWEAEALKASPFARVAVTRFGVVLSPDGGTFPLMALPARFKFAAVVGSGMQFFPWIDLRDLVRALGFILESEGLDGVFNFVAPHVITNREFTRALAFAKQSWLTVRIPPIVFRTALGKASTTVLSGQCVVPERLLDSGFEFLSPDIRRFFSNLRQSNLYRKCR